MVSSLSAVEEIGVTNNVDTNKVLTAISSNAPLTFSQSKENRYFTSSKSVNPWRAIGGAILVIGALLAINVYIRKKNITLKGKGTKRIVLMDRLSLDHKRSVVLLEIDKRRIVVGAGPEGLTRIDSWGGEFDDDLPAMDELATAGKQQKSRAGEEE